MSPGRRCRHSPRRPPRAASPSRSGSGTLTMMSPANTSGGHADPAYLDSSGPAAPPRDNGELVFAAPWESRAFGLALALTETGLIDWEDFRQALIREIGDWEAAHPSGEGWSYYECWLRALERTATTKGLVAPRALADRAEQLTALPAGHDHDAHRPGGHEHNMHNEAPHHR
jgi:nitrile hydratase accessory protein